MSLIANQSKYGQIKEVNVTVDELNHGYKIIGKCIQRIREENESFSAELFSTDHKEQNYMTKNS